MANQTELDYYQQRLQRVRTLWVTLKLSPVALADVQDDIRYMEQHLAALKDGTVIDWSVYLDRTQQATITTSDGQAVIDDINADEHRHCGTDAAIQSQGGECDTDSLTIGELPDALWEQISPALYATINAAENADRHCGRNAAIQSQGSECDMETNTIRGTGFPKPSLRSPCWNDGARAIVISSERMAYLATRRANAEHGRLAHRVQQRILQASDCHATLLPVPLENAGLHPVDTLPAANLTPITKPLRVDAPSQDAFQDEALFLPAQLNDAQFFETFNPPTEVNNETLSVGEFQDITHTCGHVVKHPLVGCFGMNTCVIREQSRECHICCLGIHKALDLLDWLAEHRNELCKFLSDVTDIPEDDVSLFMEALACVGYVKDGFHFIPLLGNVGMINDSLVRKTTELWIAREASRHD